MVKITPDTYKKMNEEFIEDDIPIRITIPTQEQIDKWIKDSSSVQENKDA
tara:strand:- start:590 stop:739 length:150 start_codon:yes stop_codon:yes gene_type:complete